MKLTRAVLLTRILHGAISVLFLSCIVIIYASAWRAEWSMLTVIACAALAVEASLVGLNGGDCPLGPWLSRMGDDTPFFELLMPERAAKLAVPVLGGVTTFGVLLLIARTA
jgi:hypothetical protein